MLSNSQFHSVYDSSLRALLKEHAVDCEPDKKSILRVRRPGVVAQWPYDITFTSKKELWDNDIYVYAHAESETEVRIKKWLVIDLVTLRVQGSRNKSMILHQWKFNSDNGSGFWWVDLSSFADCTSFIIASNFLPSRSEPNQSFGAKAS